MKAQLPEDSRTFTKLPSASHMGPKLYLVQNATGGLKICQDEEA